MADRLVVTKADISDETTLAALRTRLRAFNLSAQILDSTNVFGDFHRLLTDDIYDTEGKFREASQWTAEESARHAGSHRRHSLIRSDLRPAARLDRVRRLGQHAAASPWRRRTAPQGIVERRRRADARPDQRGATHRPPAEPSGGVAGCGPALASDFHRARVAAGPHRTFARGLQRSGESASSAPA